MFLNMLKGKLHNARVTQADLHYEGSIAIDEDLLALAGIIENERVQIWNIANGERFNTYTIKAPQGSKVIGLNGAAARRVAVGDRIIIAAFAWLSEEEAKTYEPNVVILDENNKAK